MSILILLQRNSHLAHLHSLCKITYSQFTTKKYDNYDYNINRATDNKIQLFICNLVYEFKPSIIDINCIRQVAPKCDHMIHRECGTCILLNSMWKFSIYRYSHVSSI